MFGFAEVTDQLPVEGQEVEVLREVCYCGPTGNCRFKIERTTYLSQLAFACDVTSTGRVVAWRPAEEAPSVAVSDYAELEGVLQDQEGNNRMNAFCFPKLPTYRGQWQAVYYTPIVGSGERLTAFVVAKGEDGLVCIRPAIRRAVIEAAFGDKAAGVLRVLDLIHESLNDWTEIPEIEQWSSPFSGFEIGPMRSGQAENIRQIAAQGIVLEAAFADPVFADLNQD